MLARNARWQKTKGRVLKADTRAQPQRIPAPRETAPSFLSLLAAFCNMPFCFHLFTIAALVLLLLLLVVVVVVVLLLLLLLL